jgi:hypothetical protein
VSSKAEENKAIVRRLVEELAKGNLDVIDKLVGPDYIDLSMVPGEGPIHLLGAQGDG